MCSNRDKQPITTLFGTYEQSTMISIMYVVKDILCDVKSIFHSRLLLHTYVLSFSSFRSLFLYMPTTFCPQSIFPAGYACYLHKFIFIHISYVFLGTYSHGTNVLVLFYKLSNIIMDDGVCMTRHPSPSHYTISILTYS